MDLQEFAGRVLAKTQIGQSINAIKAKFPEVSWQNEESKDVVSLRELLSLSLDSVDNLYEYLPQKKLFRLNYTDGDFIARASTKVEGSASFKASFIQQDFVEQAINYMGVIRVQHQEACFDIKMPGELSFDPAGDEQGCWVDTHQFTRLVGFVVVLVKAACLGAEVSFLKKVYTVTKPIVQFYYKKVVLFHWMYKQVKTTCFKKQDPPDYGEVLAKESVLCMLTNRQNAQSYLENYNEVKSGRGEFKPPVLFYNAIKNHPTLEDQTKLALNQIVSEESRADVPFFSEMLEESQKITLSYCEAMQSVVQRTQKLIKDQETQTQFTTSKPMSKQCPVF